MLASALLLLLAPPQPTIFKVDGVERKAIIVANSKPAPKEGCPVVLVFHGHGGNMNYSYRKFAIHDLWPEAIVAYPEGLPTKGMTDPEGKKNGWQQKPGDEGDRDLKFTDAILARLHEDYSVDDRRIYVMGHSNGGRFTYVLWASRPSVFAAYGPAASPAIGLLPAMKSASAFVVAGEKDEIVPFRSQSYSIQRLRTLLGIGAGPTKKDGLAAYEQGRDGLELGTYIYPGGHSYPDEAARLTVDFFKRHHR